MALFVEEWTGDVSGTVAQEEDCVCDYFLCVALDYLSNLSESV